MVLGYVILKLARIIMIITFFLINISNLVQNLSQPFYLKYFTFVDILKALVLAAPASSLFIKLIF